MFYENVFTFHLEHQCDFLLRLIFLKAKNQSKKSEIDIDTQQVKYY